MTAIDDLTEGRDSEPLGEVGAESPAMPEVVFDVEELSVYYGEFQAVQDASLKVHENEITAFIGPSGCGKTTLLRCFNRMNDLI